MQNERVKIIRKMENGSKANEVIVLGSARRLLFFINFRLGIRNGRSGKTGRAKEMLGLAVICGGREIFLLAIFQ